MAYCLPKFTKKPVMSNTWHHIYPSPTSLNEIKKGNYILKFKVPFVEVADINLHKHNKPSYIGNSINKVFVENIYLVNNNRGESLTLENINGSEDISILKSELENGRFYSASDKELKGLLPFNWS